MADFTMYNIRTNQQLKFKTLENPVPATEDELVLLAEKLTEVMIPLEVLLRVLKIANYDKRWAFEYAEQYLCKIKNIRQIRLNSRNKSCLKWSLKKIVKSRNTYYSK